MANKRRDFLKLTGLTGLGLFGASVIPGYAAPKEVPSADLPEPRRRDDALNRFPRMVQEYFVQQVRSVEQTAQAKRDALQNKKDAEEYVIEVRKKISRCFGAWPEKTPLNAKIIAVLDRVGYTIEKLTFESRPGFIVTANLYIPKDKKKPLPGVLGTVGHGRTSKAYKDEQSFAQGLVSKGYVVLVFDPIGQVERIQSVTGKLKPRHGIGTDEHIYAGNQLFLTGESVSTWFAWDAIRALDYLLTRPEVDPKHIGVTGSSGGGMQTAFLCAVDPRITMAAPSCWVTTYRRNMENEEPADTEQCLPGVLAAGIDQCDFIASMAPKPVMLLTQEKDFFDTRGTEEAFARLKKLYKLLGKEENIQIHADTKYHSYSKANREAMYSFFNNLTEISADNAEPEIILENPEALWCTPKGQIDPSASATMFSITNKLSVSQKVKRGNISGKELNKVVSTALNLPKITDVADYRILRPFGYRRKRQYYTTYAVETEPGIFALVYHLSYADLYSRIPQESKTALLYISHLSADVELREEDFIADLLANNPDAAFFACDVRGIGESKPNTCSISFEDRYGSDYFYAIHSIMLGYPYIGQKTFDVIRVVDLLKAKGYEKIHLAGKGWGALPATFAALLSDNVTQVTLKNALSSYSNIAESEDYNWPLATLLPGVLKTFDLPDCYRELRTKNLQQIEPWGALGDI